MGIFGTLAHWASRAWSFIFGIPGDVGKALDAAWRYITNVHNVLAWLAGGPLLKFALTVLGYTSGMHGLATAVRDALHRVAGWIWLTMVRPVRDALNQRITRLAAWTLATFQATWAQMYRLYAASLAYTRLLVGVERAARIRADQAEHAAMLARVKAAVDQLEREAADGYNSGLHARLGLVGVLLNDLADRQPEIRGLVKTLVTAVFDLETIDNPVVRLLVTRTLAEVIGKLGVDKLTGDLIGRLLGPLTGQARARGLQDVTHDVSVRLDALEAQWGQFMTDGGPEVEQAGKEWKNITSLATDAAMLAFLGLAVTEPSAWARGVADTVGAAGNDTLGAIVALIGRA